MSPDSSTNYYLWMVRNANRFNFTTQIDGDTHFRSHNLSQYQRCGRRLFSIISTKTEQARS